MKKRILSVALVICMVAMLAMGSLAYLSATDTVTNKFSTWDSTDPDVGPEGPEGEDIFDLDLFETDPENPDDPKVDGLEFKDVKPGDVLHKDPTVENTGKYDAWVRLTVTVTNAKNWQAACVKHGITDLTTIFGGHDDTAWTLGEVVADEAADTLSYTYYFNYKLAKDQKATLFNTVTIPAVFDQYDMAALANFDLIITADAIQADNNGETVFEGFEAWTTAANAPETQG